jgi:hypothetical protein
MALHSIDPRGGQSRAERRIRSGSGALGSHVGITFCDDLIVFGRCLRPPGSQAGDGRRPALTACGATRATARV